MSSNAQYPNYKDKHRESTLIEPKQFADYMRGLGKYPKVQPPKGVIICYQNSLYNFIKNNHKTKPVNESWLSKLLFLEETQDQIAVIGDFGIGSPVAAIILEELIAFGVQKFISIGTCGTLQKHINIGDVVVCDRAIRDEGTSHHYLQTQKYAYPSKDLTSKLMQSFTNLKQNFHVGTSWTVDAIYRETVAEAKHYQQEGALVVEMEASALFAVAEFRKIPLASAFTISDSLAELKWQPEFHSPATQLGLETMFQAAVAALKD